MNFKQRVGDDNGIQTNVWGPPGWMFLHSIAQNYPWKPTAEKRESYLTFFKTVAEVLPCGKCRDSYRKYITTKGTTPDTYLDHSKLDNRLSCVRWLYNVHSKVNDALGKKNEPFKTVWNRYESYRSKCNNKEEQVKLGCIDPMYGLRKKCQIEVVSFGNSELKNKTTFGKGKINRIILVSIKKSKRPGKKYTATFKVSERKRIIHFGASGMSDFTKHHDTTRRNRYIKRHLKDLRTGNPLRAGYLSMFILWNKKSLKASIADYRRRLNIYNKSGRFPKKIN